MLTLLSFGCRPDTCAGVDSLTCTLIVRIKPSCLHVPLAEHEYLSLVLALSDGNKMCLIECPVADWPALQIPFFFCILALK